MKGETFRALTARLVREGKARIVWAPEDGWIDDGPTLEEHAQNDDLDRWHDDGGALQ